MQKYDILQVVKYLETLVNIPSPTGFTQKVQNFLCQNAESKKISYKETRKGSILYEFSGSKHNKKNIMIASHVDTLGAVVCQVEKDLLRLSSIGGYPLIYVIGDYCIVHTLEGKEYTGTILPDNPAAHVNKDLKNNTTLSFENIHLRMDLPLQKKQTLKDHVQNGSFVSFDPHFHHTNGFIKSRHLDDKASAATMLYIADLLKDDPALLDSLKANVYLYFNVTEETSQGVAGFPEIDELLVMDMGCVGKNLEGNEYSVSICMKDSHGPYHYGMTTKLIDLAKKNKIPHVVDIFPFYGSDGSMALQSGKDIQVALIGPGVSASHGYERTHEKALLATLQLTLAYLI